jgi:hypothetical protein
MADEPDGLRALIGGDGGRSVSLEAFLLSLVRNVRQDGRPDERNRRDVYVAARKRRRRLGLAAFSAGPWVGVANRFADLYCETAAVCDVASLHDLELSDEDIGAHMLVLWGITEEHRAALLAMQGRPPVVEILTRRLASHASERLPERLTTRSAVKALWDARDALGDARKGGGAIRTVAFTGHRTKKVIKKAEDQLGL